MTYNFKALDYFKEICKIPHGSGNTAAISEYLMDFAAKHKLRAVKDEHNNVVIYKAASKGYEDRPTVILQGHTDMVAEKGEGSTHDFTKDELKLRVEGDFLYADNTTLGGDDGIAVAYALAILEDDTIQHPALEAVFTSDEEIGMIGASHFDSSLITGKYLLNCDSEEEGILTAGCAGGIRVDMSFDMEYMNIEALACTLIISGLKGGHSGCEIDKNRANAHVLLGRLLNRLDSKVRFSIATLEGGTKDNAIANFVKLNLMVEEEDYEEFESICKKCNEDFLNEYSGIDEDIKITVERHQICTERVLTLNSLEILISMLLHLPDGVIKMDGHINGLVETSSNIGILGIVADTLKIGCLIRSSIDSAKYDILNSVTHLCELLSGECQSYGDYPGWKFDPKSHLIDVFCDSYKKLFDKEAKVTTIHAGLECGLFKGMKPDLEIISFGPDIIDIHTCNEHLNIPSAYRTWELILEVLKNI